MADTVACPGCRAVIEVRVNRRNARIFKCEHCRAFGNLPRKKEQPADGKPEPKQPEPKPKSGWDIFD